MVPMLTCGLVRSNFAFATGFLLGMDLYALLHRRQVIFAGCQAYGALFALGLRDDLLGDVPRNLGVGVELHGVAGPARSLRPQVTDVAEHLRQRNQALDDPGTAALLHGLDLATAGVEVADDVTHVVLGRGDLDGHHRFEEHGARLAGTLLERLRSGDLERQFGGVDLVVAAVDQGDANA